GRTRRLRNASTGKCEENDESKNLGVHNDEHGKTAVSKSIQFGPEVPRALSTPLATALERRTGLSYGLPRMLDMFLGCLKWAAVGFIVAFALMKLFEASHIHDDIPKPAFKIRQTKRATFVLSTFAAMLSALVWLLVQKLD